MSAPEFSRPFTRHRINAGPVQLAATEAERAALARRFSLVAIDRLEAALLLEATGNAIGVSGTLDAAIVQACAVSGEDLALTLHEPVTLRFVPEDQWAKEAEEVELEADELDEVPYDGTTFDLGEAVAQSLALAIDPFSTGPQADAVRKERGLLDEHNKGPLAAALAKLQRDLK